MLINKRFFFIHIAIFIISNNYHLKSSPEVTSPQYIEINTIQKKISSLNTELHDIRNVLNEFNSIINQYEPRVNDLTDSLNYFQNATVFCTSQAINSFEKIKKNEELNEKYIKTLEYLQLQTEDLKGKIERNEKTITQHSDEYVLKIKGAIKAYADQIIKPLIESFNKDTETLEHKIAIAQEKAKIEGEIKGKSYIKGIQIECKTKQKIIKNILSNGAIAIITAALGIYSIKYGIPFFLSYFTQPHIISETSKTGIFEWFKPKKNTDNTNENDLIFTPLLQKQLSDLLQRVQTAKKYHENLPNILFYGPPGTGKTAFAKVLATTSGLDYALTSGSEFAKITDLNHATNELRNLLHWATKSKNGLILFIDEAESLFAHRKLTTTSKKTQDFINTFLSLVSEQSQKKIMFIFATNHPCKLDDALTNRIGINIEFPLPEAQEREKIFALYLMKFSQENPQTLITLSNTVIESFSEYALLLDELSPRSIRFIAEEIIINTRRCNPMQVTHETIINSIHHAKKRLLTTKQWEEERSPKKSHTHV